MPAIREIRYVDELPKDFGPASTVPGVNICFISKKIWKRLSDETKTFVLCHEEAHARGIISETLADAYAFRCLVGLGIDSKKAVYPLTDLLAGTRREHYIRVYNQLLRQRNYECQAHGKCKPLNLDKQWLSRLITPQAYV